MKNCMDNEYTNSEEFKETASEKSLEQMAIIKSRITITPSRLNRWRLALKAVNLEIKEAFKKLWLKTKKDAAEGREVNNYLEFTVGWLVNALAIFLVAFEVCYEIPILVVEFQLQIPPRIYDDLTFLVILLYVWPLIKVMLTLIAILSLAACGWWAIKRSYASGDWTRNYALEDKALGLSFEELK